MSITLMAYPMAFLVAPENVKDDGLQRASDKNSSINKASTAKNLFSIRVLTNITSDELSRIMSQIDCQQIRSCVFQLPSGLKVEWILNGKYAVAEVFGVSNPEKLQTFAEELFQKMDGVAQRNVRLIESSEYFYYNYETSYTSMKDVYDNLKSNGAERIFSTSNNEVVAHVDGQDVKYYKREDEQTFILEVEQVVRILNIGMTGGYEGRNVSYGLQNLKIQTNIKPEELKQLLYEANYLYYEAGHQTPLKNSDATLNWSLKDGYYTAEFSGSNNAAITKEAEIIFRKLNRAAGRDLRYINDISTAVYTYSTNYTDKGMLLNTLVEHGAEEIAENGDEVSCKLFGMEMIYYKKDGSAGYILDITQVSDKAGCEDVINDLNEEYGLNIQEMTYNKIKERLDSENMRLESEVVMDDNSIILTIEV